MRRRLYWAACLVAVFATAIAIRAQGSILAVGIITVTVVTIDQETSGSVSIVSDRSLSDIPALRVISADLPLQKPAERTAPEPAVTEISVDLGDGSRHPATAPFFWVPRPGEISSSLRLFFKDPPDPILTTTVPA